MSGCRRKLKKERELVADINKTFKNYCERQGACTSCTYRYSVNCKIEYLKDLLKEAEECE